jgi:tRNA1(Val) A37 N6-methylase TrmN6
VSAARLETLTRCLRIWQRPDGHKAASDDVVLAGLASAEAPQARRCLDLGTGKGTVAMLLSVALPEATFLGVEAYEESFRLAVQNIAENGLGQRFQVRHADLRDAEALAGEAPFDLVTGAPPFMRLGSGPPPRDPQRAAGRFELRGGVEAYADAAAAHLAPGGRFVVLMDGVGGRRAEAALRNAGLAVQRWIDVRPRPDRPPTYQVLVAASTPAGPTPAPDAFTMRPAAGEAWSPEFAALRRRLDLPGA